MADKPSRALILYGDGLARFVDPSNSHIHSLASLASCGFLSLPHAPPDKDVSVFPIKAPQEDIIPAFAGLVPRQSYTMQSRKTRDDVRHYCPMLVAQWQHGVTRKDLVETLKFEAFKKLCGNLVIPVDRFIHEVAFKLWKAPKYGA